MHLNEPADLCTPAGQREAGTNSRENSEVNSTPGRPDHHPSTESIFSRRGKVVALQDRTKWNSNTQPPVLNAEYPTGNGRISNIIIFGATGVGKSSVINLIAGQPLAHTSNKALGCTFHHQPYEIALGEIRCRLWDTAGLDEGTEGTVPASQAEHNLEEFIQRMAHSGGINLLVYCIRGARLTKALRSNYDIFYSGVCRKKVPVALVVTGLENEKNGMEAWWDKNEQTLRGHGMRFDAHACVTTLDLGDKVGQERQSRSQERLRDLVVTYSKYPPWEIEQSFMSWLFPTLRRLIRGTPSSDEDPPRQVIVYDRAAKAIQFPPGITSSCTRCSGLVGNRQYEFIYVDESLQLPSRPADWGLLVYYTSTLVDTRTPEDDVVALKKFYDAAGGLMYPMIVVLTGCHDERVAQNRWDVVASRFGDIHAYPIFLPDATDYIPGSTTELMKMMERLWIAPLPVKSESSKFQRVLASSKHVFADTTKVAVQENIL